MIVGIIGDIGIGTIATMSVVGTIMVGIVVGLTKVANPGGMTRAMRGMVMADITGFVTTKMGTVSMVDLVLKSVTATTEIIGTTVTITSRNP